MTPTQPPDWWPFERQMLRRDQLVIERYDGTDGYQRRYSQRFVDAAVRDFDPVRFDALKVALVTDGRHLVPGEDHYAVIDGQHRDGMAEALGLELVPCDVYARRMSYRERALIFHKLNRVRQMLSVNDGARALAEGEDPDFLGLLYLLERHRFYLHGFRPANANGHRALHATRTLQIAYEANAKALEDALDVLQPWQPLIGRRVERVILGALMMWCRRSDVDLARLRGILEQHGPDYLLRAAGEEAARSGRQNPTARHMAIALLGHYNLGLRVRRIEDGF